MSKLEVWLQIFLAALQAFAQAEGASHHQIASNARSLADESMGHLPAGLIETPSERTAQTPPAPPLEAPPTESSGLAGSSSNS